MALPLLLVMRTLGNRFPVATKYTCRKALLEKLYQVQKWMGIMLQRERKEERKIYSIGLSLSLFQNSEHKGRAWYLN